MTANVSSLYHSPPHFFSFVVPSPIPSSFKRLDFLAMLWFYLTNSMNSIERRQQQDIPLSLVLPFGPNLVDGQAKSLMQHGQKAIERPDSVFLQLRIQNIHQSYARETVYIFYISSWLMVCSLMSWSWRAYKPVIFDRISPLQTQLRVYSHCNISIYGRCIDIVNKSPPGLNTYRGSDSIVSYADEANVILWHPAQIGLGNSSWMVAHSARDG